jgi:hypothetical protein
MIQYAVTNIPSRIATPVLRALSSLGVQTTVTLGMNDLAITVELDQRPLLDRLLDQYARIVAAQLPPDENDARVVFRN